MSTQFYDRFSDSYIKGNFGRHSARDWIEHNGKGPPLCIKGLTITTKVEVKHRDGKMEKDCLWLTSGWSWQAWPENMHITHYRIPV